LKKMRARRAWKISATKTKPGWMMCRTPAAENLKRAVAISKRRVAHYKNLALLGKDNTLRVVDLGSSIPVASLAVLPR
jgi:hypothetical protein